MYNFFIATLQLIIWILATTHPFSPLYHSAALQRGTSQTLQSPQVAFNSEQGKERKGVVKIEKEEEEEEEEEEERKYKLGMSRIGSRPPNCDHRCGHCRPCIAIQVPTNTQHLHLQFANYEPEGWKCKCGSSFFTP
ncbi:Epidermal patterning factor-like protein [Heracleum sosnowskyi]|uniref:Epidermal patterning factor-like protein n=1 Tax=Heracleum sosnowskyi TaxID=360622 RepID=A0AAD8MA73_9APIA|nr:Epidermal patterning factor-like protein [Heracleum sosnowskyi]